MYWLVWEAWDLRGCLAVTGPLKLVRDSRGIAWYQHAPVLAADVLVVHLAAVYLDVVLLVEEDSSDCPRRGPVALVVAVLAAVLSIIVLLSAAALTTLLFVFLLAAANVAVLPV